MHGEVGDSSKPVCVISYRNHAFMDCLTVRSHEYLCGWDGSHLGFRQMLKYCPSLNFDLLCRRSYSSRVTCKMSRTISLYRKFCDALLPRFCHKVKSCAVNSFKNDSIEFSHLKRKKQSVWASVLKMVHCGITKCRQVLQLGITKLSALAIRECPFIFIKLSCRKSQS